LSTQRVTGSFPGASMVTKSRSRCAVLARPSRTSRNIGNSCSAGCSVRKPSVPMLMPRIGVPPRAPRVTERRVPSPPRTTTRSTSPGSSSRSTSSSLSRTCADSRSITGSRPSRSSSSNNCLPRSAASGLVVLRTTPTRRMVGFAIAAYSNPCSRRAGERGGGGADGQRSLPSRNKLPPEDRRRSLSLSGSLSLSKWTPPIWGFDTDSDCDSDTDEYAGHGHGRVETQDVVVMSLRTTTSCSRRSVFGKGEKQRPL